MNKLCAGCASIKDQTCNNVRTSSYKGAMHKTYLWEPPVSQNRARANEREQREIQKEEYEAHYFQGETSIVIRE